MEPFPNPLTPEGCPEKSRTVQEAAGRGGVSQGGRQLPGQKDDGGGGQHDAEVSLITPGGQPLINVSLPDCLWRFFVTNLTKLGPPLRKLSRCRWNFIY